MHGLCAGAGAGARNANKRAGTAAGEGGTERGAAGRTGATACTRDGVSTLSIGQVCVRACTPCVLCACEALVDGEGGRGRGGRLTRGRMPGLQDQQASHAQQNKIIMMITHACRMRRARWTRGLTFSRARAALPACSCSSSARTLDSALMRATRSASRLAFSSACVFGWGAKCDEPVARSWFLALSFLCAATSSALLRLLARACTCGRGAREPISGSCGAVDMICNSHD
jgi:hypothetical protein